MPANYYESRFLTLGQKLPGQDKNKKSKRHRRVYRAGVKPTLEEEEGEEALFQGEAQETWVDEQLRQEISEETQRKLIEARVLQEESEEEEEEEVPIVPVDLNKVDLNNLQVQQAEDEIDDEDEADRRRARAKARRKNKQESLDQPVDSGGVLRVKVKPLQIKPKDPEDADEEEEYETESSDSSSSDESESDENDISKRRRPKFTFVSKRERAKKKTETFAESETRTIHKERKLRKAKRKEIVREEFFDYMDQMENAKDGSSDEEMPDDDDEHDKEEQFELWKVRELKRMKRVQDELDKREAELEDTEKRRGMTDREIMEENKFKPQKVRQRMKFLQKYFHKGAFFQNDDKTLDRDLMERNFNESVGADQWMDFANEALPEVMRVKNFGLASRTKYTHLADQDTTRLAEDDPFGLTPRYESIGGVGVLNRPTKSGMKRKLDPPGGNYQQPPPQPN